MPQNFIFEPVNFHTTPMFPSIRGIFPFIPSYLYYISLALQAICVIHCMRSGNQQKWIWLIVFLPYIGCIVYFFSEILPARNLGNWPSDIGSLLNPAGRIKRLENNLRFTDTFNNRVLLADAYLAAGLTDEAIELYTSSLTGAFTENEHVIKQLIAAYAAQRRYAELIPLAEKIRQFPSFARSGTQIQYARALEYTGDSEGAEREFKKMKARFSAFEARYQYGMFLVRASRDEEARQVFADIAAEAPHLSSREKRYNRAWIIKAKEELKRA
jgi:hypothetical protein